MERAARTRTLIQLGGILVKSGMVKKLGIVIGSDLQQRDDQNTKACCLLGILDTSLSFIQDNPLNAFEEKGKKLFSIRTEEEKEENDEE